MEFETIKKSHLKRNIIIGIMVIVVISAIILNFTRAKYRTTQSIPLVNGTINYSLADLNIVGLYINGVEATELDSNTKYILDTNKSTCVYKDGSAIANLSLNYDSDTKTFTISPYTSKGTKCTLYFDEKISTKDTILANYPTVLTRDNFTITVTNTTTGTIYKSKDSSQYDNYGEVYYFAGNPTDNWVKFVGFYWRIIRINGDGTIRMIYQGTNANTTGTGTQIGTSAFNVGNDNMYLGYMYQSGQVHGLETSSYVKKYIDQWYYEHLIDFSNFIAINAGFCGDRVPTTGSGIGQTYTEYVLHSRLINSPLIKCQDNRDFYTINSATEGNKALTYPIGLISADEVSYAGGIGQNSNYYLYTGEPYWTMTPFFINANSGGAIMYTVLSYGDISYDKAISYSYGVRPVINLKADVQLTGSGTSTNPYVAVGAE